MLVYSWATVAWVCGGVGPETVGHDTLTRSDRRPEREESFETDDDDDDDFKFSCFKFISGGG